MEHQLPTNISLITAFTAGLLSFLSPCVLPLIPGYISFISGESLQNLSDSDSKDIKKKVLINSLFFVIGFSIVFVLLGASATFVGKFLLKNLQTFATIAGIILIILGIHTTGIIKINALYKEKRFQTSEKPRTAIGAVVVGIAFAFGWTPCIGPILAGILAVAGTQATVVQGILLLSVYSMGLAIPFMATAWSITFFFKWFDKIKKHLHIIEWIAGILLVLIGILMITGGLTKVAANLEFLNIFTK